MQCYELRIQSCGFGIFLDPSLRISLILAFLDSAAEGAERPRGITRDYCGRETFLVEHYILPMARREEEGGTTINYYRQTSPAYGRLG